MKKIMVFAAIVLLLVLSSCDKESKYDIVITNNFGDPNKLLVSITKLSFSDPNIVFSTLDNGQKTSLSFSSGIYFLYINQENTPNVSKVVTLPIYENFELIISSAGNDTDKPHHPYIVTKKTTTTTEL